MLKYVQIEHILLQITIIFHNITVFAIIFDFRNAALVSIKYLFQNN